MLRNAVAASDGIIPENVSFVQTIRETAKIRLQMLSDHPFERLDARLRRNLASNPFDYEKPPLIHCSLLKTAETRHILSVIMPHLVSDRWSMEIFAKELMLSYASLQHNQGEAVFSPLPVQYVDYAAWQRRSAALPAEPSSLLNSNLVSFVDKGSISRHFQLQRETLEFEPELYGQVKLFVRKNAITPSMLLFACYTMLLHSLSDEDSVGIVTLQANRTHPDLGKLIGFFAGLHPVLVDFSDDPTALQVLAQVRLRFSFIMEGGHSSNGRVPISQPESPSQSSQGGHYFGFESVAPANTTLNVAGLSVEQITLPLRNVPLYAMKLIVEERGGRLKIVSEYCGDCISRQSTAIAVLVSLSNVLKQVMVSPERRASQFAGCCAVDVRKPQRHPH